MSVCHIISHILDAAEVDFGQIGFFLCSIKSAQCPALVFVRL